MATDPDGEATDTEAGDPEATETGLSQAPPVESLQKGSSLGRYLILERLGRGSAGVVYAAYDPQLDRRVALKLLRGPSPEARAIARVVHPNVCTVHEVGTWHGRVFLATELVDGTDLRAWLETEPRSWQVVLDVFLSAGHGLAAAHEAGVVHRDFKPENVLVGRDGRPRVTDFGLMPQPGGAPPEGPQWAAAAEDDAVTEAGVVLGTPGFLAPEQMEGAAATPAADQFSFAVALWQALYRQRPFAGSTMQELHGEIEHGRLQPPPPHPKVPRHLQRVLTRALAYLPSQRYRSMRELLSALENDPAAKWRRRLGYGSVALLVLAFPVGFGVHQWRAAHRCERVGAELDGVWDDARRAQLKARFESWGDDGVAQLPAALKWLDRYAELWLEQRKAACELERAGKEDPRALATRDGCLARRRVRLRAAVDTLLEADAESAALARQSFSSLGLVRSCQGRSAADQALALDEGSADAVKVQEQITRAELWSFLGRVQDAQAQAKEAADTAKRAGQHRLASEAWSALASSYDNAAGNAAQIDACKQALLEAEAGHDDEQVFDARLELALALAYGTPRYDDALWLLEQAEATATRLALPPERLSELYRVRAEVLEQAARTEEALAWAQKAYQTIDSVARDPWETFAALQTLTNVTSDTGNVAAAEPFYERLVQMQVENGDTRERKQHLELYLAETLLFLGRYQESLPHFERARLPAAAHWHAVDNAAAAGWASWAYAAVGDFETAKKMVALAGRERAALSRPYAIVESMLGELRVQLFAADYDAVAATTRQISALLEPEAQSNHAQLFEEKLIFAESLRRQGKLLDAQGALQTLIEDEQDPVQTALVRASAARLKLARGVAVPGAVSLFEESRAAIEKLEGKQTPDLGQVLLGLAAARALAGDAAGEREALEQAVALANRAPGDRFNVAETSHALALALRRAGEEAKADALDLLAKQNLDALGADLPLRRELKR